MFGFFAKFLPCEKRMAAQREARQATVCAITRNVEKVQVTCGQGYMTPAGFVPKVFFTEEHLNDVKK